jgi:hypothetical protein
MPAAQPDQLLKTRLMFFLTISLLTTSLRLAMML